MARPRGLYHNFICEKCGNSFEIKDSDVKKSNRKGFKIRFCSNTCRRTFMFERRKTRKEIWQKYNNKRSTIENKRKWHEQKYFYGNATKIGAECFICHAKNDLVIHHKDGCNGRSGKTLNNSPDNLIIICRSCHPKVHNGHWLKKVG